MSTNQTKSQIQHDAAQPTLGRTSSAGVGNGIIRESSFSSIEEALNDTNTSLTERVEMSKNYKPAFRGCLEMIIGPMFAGKSTELLRRMQRHEISGKTCLYVKYAAD